MPPWATRNRDVVSTSTKYRTSLLGLQTYKTTKGHVMQKCNTNVAAKSLGIQTVIVQIQKHARTWSNFQCSFNLWIHYSRQA